ncbi:MAG: RICIN domain-containing protein [Desulfovibrionaceae bacterium]
MLKGHAYHWAALMLFFLLLGSSEHSRAAGPVLRDGIYIIQMAGSDMTAAATSEAVQSPMILWPYRPTATWAFRHEGNNVYTVRTNSTLLDGQGARTGGSVTITRPHKGDSQRWKLKRVGQCYQFINVQTGRAMELGNGRRVKGSRLQGNTPTDSMDQLFCIQRSTAPRFCGGNGKGGDKSYDQDENSPKNYEKGNRPSRRQQDDLGELINSFSNSGDK